MLKAYKYRLYPTPEQQQKIDATISACRLVYNLALEVKIRAFKEHGVNLTAFDLCYQLIGLKEECPWLKQLDSQALQAAVKKIEVSFRNHFKGRGFPKFKSKKSTIQSFQCPNGTRRVDWGNKTLFIPKIKDIPIVLSRKFTGTIKTITISRTNTGKYFASILVSSSEQDPVPPTPRNGIGIDLGLTIFAALSTGEKIPRIRHLDKALARLRVLHRRISKKKIGGRNRAKARMQAARLMEKVRNRRLDFLHKLSYRLINDSQIDTICVEDLPVRNIMQNRKLSRSVQDASWAEFIRQLEYKGRWYGKNIIKIDRWTPSSKQCNQCGHLLSELPLHIRRWECPSCSSKLDRDVNAAKNVLKIGLSYTGAGSPGEPEELPAMAGAKNQECTANTIKNHEKAPVETRAVHH